jgi:hypothetical protein
MDSMIEGLIFVFVLVFCVWLSRISYRLNDSLNSTESFADQLDEINESVEIVANLLTRLPELMPQFHMNQNPLQPLIEKIVENWGGQQRLNTVEAPREDNGRFSDGTKKEKIS